jgi:hypothetical protein
MDFDDGLTPAKNKSAVLMCLQLMAVTHELMTQFILVHYLPYTVYRCAVTQFRDCVIRNRSATFSLPFFLLPRPPR